MSSDHSSQKIPRYEKLAKPKLKIDRISNVNPYKIKPSALSYQITDTLNKLAQPKRKPEVNIYDYPSSSTRTINTSPQSTEKSMKRKLINSSEESRNIENLGKKKNLLDSYARITATRNRRCPKRLRDLAKPKRNSIGNENAYGNFDKNYYNTVKVFAPKMNTTFGSQQKR
ncbi:uncharacterized protein LOC122637796 [Vespula pensylvanica]|uniref:Uncharacterized protein n=1 Tax=Vespula pensylvanica TaxID=30213 RepID=A0A834UER0_VESPE|nr:uncharacterized protein LOC122637796 [Vespula pensylvanica]KAF7434691.1 hypothetical protein H0235_002882 [Vespula pensylvanica]